MWGIGKEYDVCYLCLVTGQYKTWTADYGLGIKQLDWV